MTTNIKQHCKTFNEKFVCNHPIGFITSKKVDVKAGMKVCQITGKITQLQIRKIGTKEVYFLNKVHADGDVQLYGQFTNLEQAKNVNN
jgi:transcription elongation factor Elf1